MGLGSTAKKLQGLSDRAEAMYKQVQKLQDRIVGLEEEMDDTHDTVKRLDHQISEQRELLIAIADEQGLDGEQILADAAIDEVELASEDEESVDGPKTES
ncbi:DUF5798 family protein [Natronobacterium gregoryi]|uniref:Uncharacterized protein n=2 Tax=Natronobacterium gregoryi TaxID=44930 RepID=L0AD93_NATGS|nr:DUF5798 family protein [Natronobacterium gregoryi]AFZ71878.1 hypothetical protein Natgr_0630 [Natronobacterium gregoryi SP2]ELY73051.1 hypothetical protein C490_01874 [Natronobacterium gregoryi SP2]PLK19395.1 hypothetical protein CYV19_15230 [Natronobacterium gregoryi SP2]SFJ51123.1 hypothetical protein SAMN05443661_13533 [Natronobacterium gregoryi]